jgi:hypothetical protein
MDHPDRSPNINMQHMLHIDGAIQTSFGFQHNAKCGGYLLSGLPGALVYEAGQITPFPRGCIEEEYL